MTEKERKKLNRHTDKKQYVDIYSIKEGHKKPNCHIDNDPYYIDYWHVLTPEEKEWMKKYGTGTKYRRQRKIDIFTDHPDYERIKSEIDREHNYRDRNKMEEKLHRVESKNDQDAAQYYLDKIVAERWVDEDPEEEGV